MHAYCLELCKTHLDKLQKSPPIRILDVGSGSGYLTAAFAALLDDMNLLNPDSMVWGIEKYEQLASTSKDNIARAAPDLLPYIRISCGSAYEVSESTMFDLIHVGAAAPDIPSTLVNCLAPGGLMIIPIGPEGGIQRMTLVEKDKIQDVLHVQEDMDVRYVPLTK